MSLASTMWVLLFLALFIHTAGASTGVQIYGCSTFQCYTNQFGGQNKNLVQCAQYRLTQSGSQIVWNGFNYPSTPCLPQTEDSWCGGTETSCFGLTVPGQIDSSCLQNCLIAAVTPSTAWSCVTCTSWSFAGATTVVTDSLASCAAVSEASSITGFFGYGNVWGVLGGSLQCDATLTGAPTAPGGYCTYGFTCTGEASTSCDPNTQANDAASPFTTSSYSSPCASNRLNIYKGASERLCLLYTPIHCFSDSSFWSALFCSS